MARHYVKGTKQYLLELPPLLMERLAALAVRNGRTRIAEMRHALERHLASPPTVEVQVTAPPLPDGEPPAEVKRGRSKKGGA